MIFGSNSVLTGKHILWDIEVVGMYGHLLYQ
jgi:hypothetical protein